jgi:hypothetical protein
MGNILISLHDSWIFTLVHSQYSYGLVPNDIPIYNGLHNHKL